MEKITAENYFVALKNYFPELEKTLEEYGDLTHLKMERFASYTMQHLQKKNVDEFWRCIHFQEKQIDSMPDDIENAMYVSYIKSLLLGQCSQEMKNLVNAMPSKFRWNYEKFRNNYYKQGADLVNKDAIKVQTFLFHSFIELLKNLDEKQNYFTFKKCRTLVKMMEDGLNIDHLVKMDAPSLGDSIYKLKIQNTMGVIIQLYKTSINDVHINFITICQEETIDVVLSNINLQDKVKAFDWKNFWIK
jgi:hypothetical protein